MAYNMGGRRFRPVGSGKKRTAPQYGPVGTGCPFVEEAVARLYREQNEEHFWSLMNALNYALELQTKVLVPLDAAVDPQSGAAPWAHLPIPEGRADPQHKDNLILFQNNNDDEFDASMKRCVASLEESLED